MAVQINARKREMFRNVSEWMTERKLSVRRTLKNSIHELNSPLLDFIFRSIESQWTSDFNRGPEREQIELKQRPAAAYKRESGLMKRNDVGPSYFQDIMIIYEPISFQFQRFFSKLMIYCGLLFSEMEQQYHGKLKSDERGEGKSEEDGK